MLSGNCSERIDRGERALGGRRCKVRGTGMISLKLSLMLEPG